MDLTTLLVVTTIVAAGTCVQASIGFGLNLLTAPLLMLVAPGLVPGPALIANLALTAILGRMNWGDAEKTAVLWAAAGSVPGTAVGVVLVGSLPHDLLDRISALLVAAGVGMTLVGAMPARTPQTLATIGFVASIMGTTTAVNGPPVALAYRGERSGIVRGTVSLFGCWTSALSVIALASSGHLDPTRIAATTLMAPGIAIGILAAGPLTSRVSHRALSILTLSVSLGASAVLLARSL